MFGSENVSVQNVLGQQQMPSSQKQLRNGKVACSTTRSRTRLMNLVKSSTSTELTPPFYSGGSSVTHWSVNSYFETMKILQRYQFLSNTQYCLKIY